MAARRGGLGKGLDSLIPRKIKHLEFDQIEDSDVSDNESAEEEKEEQKFDSEETANDMSNADETDEDTDIDDEVNPFALEEDEDDLEEEELEEDSETDSEEDSSIIEDEDAEDQGTEESSDNQEDSEEKSSSVEDDYFEDEEANAIPAETNEAGFEEQPALAENENKGEDAENPQESPEKEDLRIMDVYESGEDNAVIMMRTSLVEPNRQQPRKKFNDATIEELAESIRLYGVIQPLLVQKRDDYYEIVAGERRWRAAKKAGLKEIPVIVREYSSQEAAEIALIENIQREDLNPIEEAQAYDRLIREFSLTQEEVATKVARSRSAITNSLRLLRLCEDVRDMVIRGDISEGHARAILALPSPGHQKMLAEQVISDKLSVRETEKLIRKIMKPAKEAKQPARDMEREAALGKVGEHLTSVFGTRVSVSGNAKGKGKIEIEFYSDEELDRIYELLQSIH